MANLCQERSQPQGERSGDAQKLRAGPRIVTRGGVRLPRAVPAAPEPRGIRSQRHRVSRSPGAARTRRLPRCRLESKPARCPCGRAPGTRGAARRGAGRAGCETALQRDAGKTVAVPLPSRQMRPRQRSPTATVASPDLSPVRLSAPPLRNLPVHPRRGCGEFLPSDHFGSAAPRWREDRLPIDRHRRQKKNRKTACFSFLVTFRVGFLKGKPICKQTSSLQTERCRKSSPQPISIWDKFGKEDRFD